MDYYSFEIDGKKCGYFQIENKGGIIASNAFIEMDNEKFENPFWVKYVGEKIIEYKFGDSEKWESLESFPANTYPSSALELLVGRLKDGESLTYDMLSEGDKKVKKDVKLIRKGAQVDEIIEGKIKRYVVLGDKGKIIEYGWGGTAKSKLVSNREEAVQDTNFK